MCHNKYLKKEFYHANKSTQHELVYDPEGVVITHVVVSYNRSIHKGQPRARFYLPDCEFVHGPTPKIRKYPNVKSSVWSDYAESPDKEWYGCPLAVPKTDTHDYPIHKKEDHVKTDPSKDSSESEEGYYNFESDVGESSSCSEAEKIKSECGKRTLGSEACESDDGDDNDDWGWEERSGELDNLKRPAGFQGPASISSERTEFYHYRKNYDDDVQAFGMLENRWQQERDGAYLLWLENNDGDDTASISSERTEFYHYQEYYDDDVQAFGILENKWHQEKNLMEKRRLYKELEKEEIAYSLKKGLYRQLVRPNHSEASFVKDKTRNRMRTRRKNNRCIGLPTVTDTKATTKNENKKHWPKERVDPVTSAAVTWTYFNTLYWNLPKRERLEKWRSLRRRKIEARARKFHEVVLTWDECVQRWNFDYEIGELYAWYRQLEKVL